MTEARDIKSMASFSVGDKLDILYLFVGFRYFIRDSVTITGDDHKGGNMKRSAVILLSFITAGCGVLRPPVVQESYFVPVIRSDVSTSGYTPTVTPMIQKKEDPRRIYTPVLR
ncbi:hypothetical protein THO17_31880 [Marinomonas sp. THO17]